MLSGTMSAEPQPQKTPSGKPVGADNLLASFAFAWGGIAYSVVHERNFRIHCAAVVYVIYFSRYYGFSRTQYALIALLLGLVVVCELFNTSIEKVVDMTTPVFNPFAKIAKDVAAGAVLVSAMISLAVAGFLFWEPDILSVIWKDILAWWYLWLPILAATLCWIFLPEARQKRRREPDIK